MGGNLEKRIEGLAGISIFSIMASIILGVIILFFAIMFFRQWLGPAEASRAAEAKTVLKYISDSCKSLYDADKNTVACNEKNLGVGAGEYGYPGPRPENCNGSQHFWYTIKEHKDSMAAFIATRCVAGGKNPQGKKADTVTLTVDYSSGSQMWGCSGQYCNQY